MYLRDNLSLRAMSKGTELSLTTARKWLKGSRAGEVMSLRRVYIGAGTQRQRSLHSAKTHPAVLRKAAIGIVKVSNFCSTPEILLCDQKEQ
ncbi:MAG: hypothetical protein ACI9ZF_002727 [Bradyrhizobium sp.]|jgi:hypothetical protein